MQQKLDPDQFNKNNVKKYKKKKKQGSLDGPAPVKHNRTLIGALCAAALLVIIIVIIALSGDKTPVDDTGSHNTAGSGTETTSPGAGSQDTSVPGTGSQDTSAPGTGSQDSSSPGAGSQDTSAPGIGSQDTSAPGSQEASDSGSGSGSGLDSGSESGSGLDSGSSSGSGSGSDLGSGSGFSQESAGSTPSSQSGTGETPSSQSGTGSTPSSQNDTGSTPSTNSGSKKNDISKAEGILSDTVFYPGKTAPHPEVIVSLNGITLEKGVDYEVIYDDSTELGWHKVQVNGIGNYIGTLYIEYEITKKPQTISCADTFTKRYGAKTFSLKATTNGDGKLVYGSSNNRVAAVSSDGKVDVIGLGTATIKIYAEETDQYKKSDVKEVTVKVIKKKQTVTLKSDSSVTKAYGDPTFAIQASSDGNGRLVYSSSNTKVVSVSNSGNVTVNGIGGAVITVYAAETDICQKSAVQKISVRVTKKAQTVTIKSSKSVKKRIGDSAFTVEASTSGNGKLVYSSSNKNVVTVNDSGRVSIKGVGGAVITVYAAETSTCKQSVAQKVSVRIQKKNQRLTVTSKYDKVIGSKNFTIKASTSGDGKLVFSSSNKKVATVNERGVASIQGIGEAKITVFAGATSTCNKSTTKTVTIIVRPQKVGITSVTRDEPNQMLVRWKRGSGITGYQIEYSRYNDFSYSQKVTVTDPKKNSRTITGLLWNNSYYVRIRTYKTVSGTNYYSGWSQVKVLK